MNNNKLKLMCKNMRKNIIDVSFSCNQSAHIGGGLSMVEILAVLYGKILKYDISNPTDPDRDYFILSKGHGVLGFYSILLEVGFISKKKFDTFQTNNSDLIAHPIMNLPIGIESSNGSLGHGLSMAVGISIALKLKKKKNKVYVLIGDGECNEGSIWESIMSGAHHKLDNLTVILDNNKHQNDGNVDDILNSGNFKDKFLSFGWDTHIVDGHNLGQINKALSTNNKKNKPKIIISNTIKGKGVSFMENNNDWHHNRITKNIYNLSIK